MFWRAGAVAACAVVLAAALIAMPHLNLGGMIAQTSSIQGTATLKEESEHLQSPAQEESTKPANPIPSAPQGSTSSKRKHGANELRTEKIPGRQSCGYR